MTRKTSPEEQLRKRAQKLRDQALKTLSEIMQGDGQTSVRLAAAREVLDRGFGRPKAGGPEPDAEPEGMTVVIRRFTDADEEGA